jgi:hypothetical protein
MAACTKQCSNCRLFLPPTCQPFTTRRRPGCDPPANAALLVDAAVDRLAFTPDMMCGQWRNRSHS